MDYKLYKQMCVYRVALNYIQLAWHYCDESGYDDPLRSKRYFSATLYTVYLFNEDNLKLNVFSIKLDKTASTIDWLHKNNRT